MTNVGIRITWAQTMPYGGLARAIPTPQWGNGFRQFILHEYSLPITLEFFKLGETISGTLQGTLVNGRFSSKDQSRSVEALRLSFSAPIVIDPPKPLTPTCRPVSSERTFPLAKVRITDFQGPGSTAGEQEFTINMHCRQGSTMRAYVTLSDVTTPTNTSQVLTLTQDSTATGIGLQVLKDGSPLYLGPHPNSGSAQWYAGQVQASQDWQAFDIPLKVRYVQLQPQINAGSANGRMTFTLDYQ